jgi:hypothetical protein
MMPIAPMSGRLLDGRLNASGVRHHRRGADDAGQVSIIRRTSSHDMVLCCISNQTEVESACRPRSRDQG